MKNKGLIATIVVLIAVIITLIAVMFLMQMPTILSSDVFNGGLFGINETTLSESADKTDASIETSEDIQEEIPQLTTISENFTGYNNHVSIDYPQIKGMSDSDFEYKLNNKIKTNALSIIPLYPISTAVQNLDITYEVKNLDEDYITIIYKGKVVGINAGSSSSNSNSGSGKSSGSKSSSTPDPYLDGFVDPLAGIGQAAGQSNLPQVTIINSFNSNTTNSLPTPSVEVINNNNNSTSTPTIEREHTADKGPTVKEIKAPTSASSYHSTQIIGNTATNNPTGGNVSVGQGPYSVSGQVSGYSKSEIVEEADSMTIYGHSNTNANNIDQKIYYTNTINLNTGLDLTLSDYISDFNELAKYLRSSKVEFENIDEDDRKAVREYINKTVQSKYVEQMKAADFRNEGVKSWPKIFSYKDVDGTVYFSVKLSSKLGNYAIVKYN